MRECLADRRVWRTACGLVTQDGLLKDVLVDADPQPDDVRLARRHAARAWPTRHSHAFHRALRGRVNGGGGNFWSWREQMYAVTRSSSTPTRTSRWHGPSSPRWCWPASPSWASSTTSTTVRGARRTATPTPWVSPCARPPTRPASGSRCSTPATSRAASTAAATCELHPGQRRFSDGTVEAWAERMSARRPETDRVRLGAAIHSVRAVKREDLPRVVEAAGDLPLHVHLSEQHGENLACQMFYGASPTELLDEAGALGAHATAVHATHLDGPRHRAARRHRHRRLLLPDDRARPRRRHRPRPRPARRRQPALARLRPARRHRPLRGAARPRDARAARHQRARPLLGQRPAPRGLLQRLPRPSAGPTAAT